MDAASTGQGFRRGPDMGAGTGAGDTVTRGLQKMFAAIADEPIPDDFLRLLDEIDERVKKVPGGNLA
ncbi:hypothetical protein GCM10011529_19140 [Polymorphobacter glacialis]|uniref:Anti-sigma factor NepR domain-containing protein n=2 Tax=Sandarakinorhabdus glacialis TaxID=1614636 RepID=A0A916ZU72_9SPHN|nr:hypothetical protein GCM10011529_19140 [Polymorphobacter glacialis]